MEALYDMLNAAPLPLPACTVKKNGVHVCIIGGGGTGGALAYDLSLRGFTVTLLEKGELTSGTTGRHHGQLHCGARYAYGDRNIARECFEESVILSRIAGSCIEYNGGFFIALTDEEADFEKTFIEGCLEAGIPARKVEKEKICAIEPRLAAVKTGVFVPDGTFDAFRLPMMFFAGAKILGAKILPWHEVTGFDITQGRMQAVFARNLLGAGSRVSASEQEVRIEADYVVNASGAWAGKIGELAGIEIPITPAPGSMVAVKGRLTDRVISRMRPPSDGDILVPQRGLTIIGSTQRVTENPDGILPTETEIQFLRAKAEEMIPGFASLPVYAAWAAARPLAGSRKHPIEHSAEAMIVEDVEGRGLSRDFMVLDHSTRDHIEGFATISGGKATVLRAMAEKAANFICAALKVESECRTADYSLPSWREYFRGGML